MLKVIKNNNVNGEIKGKNIWEFVTMIDWTIDNVEERIKYIYEILEAYEVDGVEFYHEYFDEIYNQEKKHSKVKVVIGKDDPRCEESNISKALEILGSYILGARDEVENRKKENVKYKIYNSKELFDRFKDEKKLVYKLSTVNVDKSNNYDRDDYRFDNNNESVFAIFQLPKNYKKAKDITVTQEDFEKYPILKEYEESIVHMKNKYDKLLSIDENKIIDKEELESLRRSKNMIRKNLKLLKQDMLDVKKQLQKPIIWKAPLKDSGCPDYDMLDMFDKNVVKELLKVHKQVDLQDDLSCILVDLENLINKVEFTDRQKEVLNMWENGICIDDIAKDLKVRQNTISKTLDRAIESIIKQYEEEYEDWYYLNIRKGTYKKCSKCGEIKLISQFDKKGKQGFQSRCKKCRKK